MVRKQGAFGFAPRRLRLAGAGAGAAAARRSFSAMTAISSAAMAVTVGLSIGAALGSGAGRMGRMGGTPRNWSSSSLQRGQHTKLSKATIELLRNRDPELLNYIKNLENGYQLFDYGYVWTKGPAGKAQLRKKLLLNDGELVDIINMLARLEHKKGEPPFKEVMTRIIKAQAGELIKNDPRSIEELSLDDLYKMTNGLTFRDSLLTRRLKDFKEGKERKQLQHDLNERYRLVKHKMILEDVRAGRVYKYEPIIDDKNFGGIEVTKWGRQKDTGKDKKRDFRIPGDDSLKWYWIDFEGEWP